MDTHKVYERLMLGKYLYKMKYLRNGWNDRIGSYYHGVASLIDVTGEEHRQYESIMNECSEIIYEMLNQLIMALIKEHNIPVKYYDLRMEESDAYYVGKNKNWKDYLDQHKWRQIFNQR